MGILNKNKTSTLNDYPFLLCARIVQKKSDINNCWEYMFVHVSRWVHINIIIFDYFEEFAVNCPLFPGLINPPILFLSSHPL